MSFKITAESGNARSQFVFASAAAPAAAVEIHVDVTKFAGKGEVSRLLRAMVERLDESNTDWPPA